MNKKAVIIVAGGKGIRMSSEIPKQFIQLKGKAVLMHTIEAFYNYDNAMQIVLVLPKEHKNYWSEQCKKLSFNIEHKLVEGGSERFYSVKNGLEAIKHNEVDLIAIHDGVRPFVSQDTIGNCFEKAKISAAVIPALDLTDSIRKLENEKSVSVDRSLFKAVQTPQVFQKEVIYAGYRQEFSSNFTDDASVVEAAGYKIELVDGNRENIKLTTPFDFIIADALMNK